MNKPIKSNDVDLDRRRQRLLIKQAIGRIERAEYEQATRFGYLSDDLDVVGRRGHLTAQRVA